MNNLQLTTNTREWKEYLVRNGCPSTITMDFSYNSTNELVDWLIEMDTSLDEIFLPFDFTMIIKEHSGVNTESIERKMKDYIRTRT